jgi:hypothetical protein
LAREEISIAASALMAEIKRQDAVRQSIEDTRSIRRNRNRLLTLLVALFLGLAVVWTLPQLGAWFGPFAGHWGKILAPYAFVITITLDSSLAIYSYVRRY